MRRLIALAGIAALATGCAGRLSESQEYYVGRAICADSVAKAKGGVLEDEALHEYVAKIGWTVALASDRPETFMGYNFIVLQSDEVGAWAAPSGFIFVTTAALALMDNEDQLAAVLAHEIAHVNLRHPEEIARQEANKKGLMDILGAIASVAKEAGAEDLAKLAEGLGAATDEIGKRAIAGYGQDAEMESDRRAVDYLTRPSVRYNPAALADFLEKLPARTGEAAQGPYATHPGNQQRIDAVRAEVQRIGAKTEIDPNRTKRFREMTARLRP